MTGKFYSKASSILWVMTNDVAKVGGQAIIEGVMMRSKHSLSMAVRKEGGEIVCKRQAYLSMTKRIRALGLPVVRGFVQLIESLVLGIKALSFSADVAMEEEKRKKNERLPIGKSWKDTLGNALMIIFSIAVALLIFMYLPLWFSNLIKKDQNPFVFNITAGIIRIFFFLVYLWCISFFKDIRRVFEYHGAEHKAIFMYESGKALSVENAKDYHTHHPRCGTSFLLIVAVVCIILFAIIDGLIGHFIGPYPNVFYRFLAHFAFIPLVSGLSYEILKVSSKTENRAIRLLSKPGLWLQRITTKEPDSGQLEVAFTALKAVI